MTSGATLRVLAVVEAAGGGVGRHVVDLCQGLAGSGHEVHVLYSPRRAEDWFAAALGDDRKLRRAEIAINRRPGPTDLAALRAIRRYVMENGPFDVVHGHSTKGALGCMAVRAGTAARILTPHALRSLDPRLTAAWRLVYTAVERVLLGYADRVIAVSPVEEAHARRIGVDPAKLVTVINGLAPAKAPDRQLVRAALGLGDDQVAIGFVGRLAAQKAPARLLDAFSRVAPSYPNARLVMVGEGPLESGLKSRSRRLGIDGAIVWAGAANGREVMAALDIFALTSAYEAMPYVLLEAAAAALPIVVTEVGGARTVVEPGANGFIVANWDCPDFAARLGALVGEPALRARMAKASRARSRSFRYDRMISETVAVYRLAIAKYRKLGDVPSEGGQR